MNEVKNEVKWERALHLDGPWHPVRKVPKIVLRKFARPHSYWKNIPIPAYRYYYRPQGEA